MNDKTLKFKVCPKCGTTLTQSADERFCRSCGLDLLSAAEKLKRVVVLSAPKKKDGSTTFIVTITVIAVIVVGLTLLLIPRANNPAILSTPTFATQTPDLPTPFYPTATHQPIVQTTSMPPCYRWDQITKDMYGKTVCVYGVITDFIQAQGAMTRYRFSSKLNTFFLFSKDSEIIDPKTGKTLAPGTCIRATAPIHFNGAPYIDIGDLVGAPTGPRSTELHNIYFYEKASDCNSFSVDMPG